MNYAEYLINRARREYHELGGVLTTSTVMQLSAEGLDVESIEAQFYAEDVNS